MKTEIHFHGGDAEHGDVFMVETHAPAGHVLEQHAHDKAHMSYLVRGEALVEVDGISTKYTGPCVLAIAAHKVHAVHALTGITWLCLWATDEKIQQQAKDSLKLVKED
jgi:quercetin dioxygenase-like cupin family protein